MTKNLFIFLSLIFLSLDGFSQTLSNGIQLPEEWPPRRPMPTVAKEMPLPYLEHKPVVIPVNNGRQLFVDNFLVAETNLTTICHKPDFYEGNPVLQPDKEWEYTTTGLPYAAPFSDGLWYDEIDKKFKMWYMAGANAMHKADNQGFYTCYAESDDGIHWRKPELDIIPGTNVVDTLNRDASTVWLDRFEKDPSKRYKFFNVEKNEYYGTWQIVLKYSPDGIHWSRGVAQSGGVSDRSTAFYNPFTKRWALSLRGGTRVSGRSRFYTENADPEQLVSQAHSIRSDADDRNVVFWFSPDDKELHHPKYPEVNPGIYNFDVIAYESIMIGQYAAWCGPENNICARDGIQKRNVVSLGFSRDGFHFYRPTHEPFMNVNETEGAWNWGNMQSVCGVPLIVGDSLYFYSSGRRLNSLFWDCYTSTGLARLRRDGFVSMHADKTEGYLTTEKITFDGSYLFVNADVSSKKGSLVVEILDEDGNAISGFTRNDCIPMRRVDSTKYQIRWKDNVSVASLIGKTVSLRFHLRDADFYSFWISPWSTGESRGFTAGGGPNLNPSGIDER